MEVRDSPWDGTPVATFNGHPPTPTDLERIEADGLPVWIQSVPENKDNLDFLLPIAGSLRALTVGYGAYVEDIRAIEAMVALEDLTIDPSINLPADLARLQKLRSFRGSSRRVNLWLCFNLEHLKLWLADATKLTRLQAPLRNLSLNFSSRRRHVLPFGEGIASLQSLSVYGAQAVDLRNIDKYSELRNLEIADCGSVESVATVLRLPMLERLVLDNVPVLDEYDTLPELAGARVIVSGRNPFDGPFRRSVEKTGRWSFPIEKRYRGEQIGRHTSALFIHPAMQQVVPEVSVTPEVLNNLQTSWDNMSEVNRDLGYMHTWESVLRWAAARGANKVTRLELGAPDAHAATTALTSEGFKSLGSEFATVSYITLLRDDVPLVRVNDSIEDGVVIYPEDGDSEIPQVHHE